MITPQNILRHELIGLRVTVEQSPNKYEEGISGIIIDETRNTLRITTGNGIKCLEKQYKLLRATLPDSVQVIIDGNALSVSPTRRVSMRVSPLRKM
ncbi:MAG: ribonuclease P protein subunit [Methanocorpusculum sp.]|jgi:ribonuclease P protein subunit POP4|nr:ribonuclease P protein subunit [Methanocorpusculum sp.]MDD2470340.1 ribonuclease P protein subunit [Methanocorpusculum sp.]MDD4132610.1 ribonuclease P protein subunit [Methanocorpusculum sp.]